MPTLINYLYVCPTTSQHNTSQYLQLSKGFSPDVKFKFSFKSALEHLQNINPYQFPTAIIIDESMGEKNILDFISSYRAQFYSQQIDTLLFVCQSELQKTSSLQFNSIISGVIHKPFNKTQFMEKVFPQLTVYMV